MARRSAAASRSASRPWVGRSSSSSGPTRANPAGDVFFGVTLPSPETLPEACMTVSRFGAAPRLLAALGLYALVPSLLPAQRQETAPAVANSAGDKKADPLGTEGYISPPDEIARLVNAPRESNFSWTNTNPGSR